MSHRAIGPLLVLGGLVCIQSSAAIAAPVLGSLGVSGVVGARFFCGAIVLLVFTRPRLRGRSREEWVQILIYGLAMSGMTAGFYSAVDRLPLGTAATLVYLGPFCVAIASIRRRWELLLPVVALIGVILISRPSSDVSSAGIVFGLLAGAGAASYTVFAQRVGHASPGLDGLALSTSVAAVLFLPASVHTLANVDAQQATRIAIAGVMGVCLGFALDFTGIRRSSARVASTLYSLEPAIAAVLGAALLGQGLEANTMLGLMLVVCAGLGAAATVPTRPRQGEY